MTKVAFQGAPGAYSYEAIEQFFGAEAERVPKRTFADIFTAVEEGTVDYGILPVENAVAALQGTVHVESNLNASYRAARELTMN